MENDVKEMNKKVIMKALAIIFILIAAFVLLLVIMNIYNKRKAEQRQIEYRESADNYVSDFDEENYFKEKERLEIPSSEPVTEYGAMNVGGDTYYLGMTMQEIVDFGYSYHEWLDGDEIGSGSLAVFLEGEEGRFSMPPMLNCYFSLVEGGDADSYEDYRLTSLRLNHFYLGGYQKYYFGHMSYNAEIIHGIKTDMSYREIMDILEPYEEAGQARIELLSDGGSIMFMRLLEGETVYVFTFKDMYLNEINMFREDALPSATDRLKRKFSLFFKSL